MPQQRWIGAHSSALSLPARSDRPCSRSRWRRSLSPCSPAYGSVGARNPPPSTPGSASPNSASLFICVCWSELSRLGLACQVRKQGAELLGDLGAEHASHDRAQWPADLNRLTHLRFRTGRLDAAVEAK